MARDIDETIIALLQEQSRYFAELHKEIVEVRKICSKQTLCNHIKRLKADGQIKRTLLENGRTRYEVLRSEKSERIQDRIALDLLMEGLDLSIIDRKIELVKIERRRRPIEQLLKQLKEEENPFRNTPKLKISLQCDPEFKEKTALFGQLNDLSQRFIEQVKSTFVELEAAIPPSISTDYQDLCRQLSSFDQAQTLSKNFALKHKFRFLLYSWFDGEGYANRVSSASKKLASLAKGHERDIQFLDEICNRYYYAWNEYRVDIDIVREITVPKIVDGCHLNSLLEDAFWLYNWERYDLCALEAVLTSDSICTDEKVSTIDTIFQTKEKVPFKIVTISDYMKLKMDLLDHNHDKQLLLRLLLSELTEQFNDMLVDQLTGFLPQEKIDLFDQNLGSLNEEFDLLYPQSHAQKPEELRNDPIFNFKFVSNGIVHDYSNNPLVMRFLEYIRENPKKAWLTKCLETGIPIYHIMPFDRLLRMRPIGRQSNWLGARESR